MSSKISLGKETLMKERSKICGPAASTDPLQKCLFMNKPTVAQKCKIQSRELRAIGVHEGTKKFIAKTHGLPRTNLQSQTPFKASLQCRMLFQHHDWEEEGPTLKDEEDELQYFARKNLQTRNRDIKESSNIVWPDGIHSQGLVSISRNLRKQTEK